MLLAVANAKGGVGATTVAWALAVLAAEQGRATLMVEADPQGGCLAARLGLGPEPGLVSLAAAARHTPLAEVVIAHAQATAGGPAVVVGPGVPRQARAALAALGQAAGAELAGMAHEADAAVLVDLGRLDEASAALALATAADELVWVTRPDLDGADAVGARLADLGELAGRSHLVTSGEGPYSPAELAEALSVPLVGHLPHDARGARQLWGGAGLGARGPLRRAVAAVGMALSIGTEKAPGGASELEPGPALPVAPAAPRWAASP